jgi:sulfate adenylyltransferase subunit 1 (EFTu-like GTPase family)
MANLHRNISGELTQELLAAGGGVKVTYISLVNIHASTTCTVDLYIEKRLTGKFYIIKSLQLPVGATLVLEGNDVKFNNKANQFGLYIKLTQGASETPTVDVIIS